MTETYLPSTPTLLDLISRFHAARVLVVGDIILDRFIYGDVHRLSSEAPIPILNVTRENAMPGGAGNTLANLAALSVQVSLASVIADDEGGAYLRRYLDEMAIKTDGLVIAKDRPTPVKIRYMVGTQQMFCVHHETLAPIPPEIEMALKAQITDNLAQVDSVILSDYGRGVMTPGIIRHTIDTAKERGVRVLVDPRHPDFSIYRGADIITPNRKELARATHGLPTATDADIETAGAQIFTSTNIGAIVATRSQDGMSVMRPGQTPLHLQACARDVFDVSGAGDTVIATLAAALSIGADLSDAAYLANLAGGIVVGKAGTAKIYPRELANAVQEGTPSGDMQARILTWAEAKDAIQRWKALGQSVGFTNGCFDIMHQGHVTYLHAARARCDHLIVGLNSDASVARLKGPGRPFNDGASRAHVMAALSSVDGVVLFGNDLDEKDTACQVIAALEPDIYFKAGDYTPDTLPETPTVRAVGGRVEIMPFVEGYSTTATLNRMQRKDVPIAG